MDMSSYYFRWSYRCVMGSAALAWLVALVLLACAPAVVLAVWKWVLS